MPGGYPRTWLQQRFSCLPCSERLIGDAAKNRTTYSPESERLIGVMAKNQTTRSPESKRLIEVKAKNQTTRSPEKRVIMLEAMKQRGKSLRYATCEHETDREFMLEAMKQRRNSLKHAAPEHKFVPGPFYFDFWFVPGFLAFLVAGYAQPSERPSYG